MAQLINAPSADDIVWTRGTTEAINWWRRATCVRACSRAMKSGERSGTPRQPDPRLMVAEQTGARVVKLPIGADRLPDLTQLPTLLNDKTRLLALGQMSNVTGGCPDLAPAIALAHAAGARVMIDGAQGVVHGPADVQRLDIDFYAFSGHKLARPASARCTAKPSCWRRWRRGKAAARC